MIPQKRHVRHISWTEYNAVLERWVDVVVSRLASYELIIDHVVGIFRGGIVPASRLTYAMLSTRDASLAPLEFQIRTPSRLSLPKQNTLLVDDIIDSGKTRLLYPNYPFTAPYCSDKFAEITDAPLFTWYAEVYPHETALVFPYETTRDWETCVR